MKQESHAHMQFFSDITDLRLRLSFCHKQLQRLHLDLLLPLFFLLLSCHALSFTLSRLSAVFPSVEFLSVVFPSVEFLSVVFLSVVFFCLLNFYLLIYFIEFLFIEFIFNIICPYSFVKHIFCRICIPVLMLLWLWYVCSKPP